VRRDAGLDRVLQHRQIGKVDATVDNVQLTKVGLMPKGTGGHMPSISAKLRKQLGKKLATM
jgi:hypothetical protein